MWLRVVDRGARRRIGALVAKASDLCNLSGMTGSERTLPSPCVMAALEAIYTAFAVQRPRIIEGCPCCIDTRRVDVLLAKPLRELTGEDLWRYVSGVFLTIGSDCDFRYLLPRILELAIIEPGTLPNTEIVLGKFERADQSSWSREQRAAVKTLVDVWFDHALWEDLREAEDWLISSEAEAVLCGAARGGFDLKPLLSRLAATAAAPVRSYLADTYAKQIANGSVPRGFWEDVPTQWREIAAAIVPE